MDNYMEGNKPFTQLDDEDPAEKWQERVDQIIPDELSKEVLEELNTVD